MPISAKTPDYGSRELNLGIRGVDALDLGVWPERSASFFPVSLACEFSTRASRLARQAISGFLTSSLRFRKLVGFCCRVS
jgi:hypothetical protein